MIIMNKKSLLADYAIIIPLFIRFNAYIEERSFADAKKFINQFLSLY